MHMMIRTRIQAEAHARGFTVAELARRLGWYRSNLSAMDAGRRAISLRALSRVAALLGCSPGELIDDSPEVRLFRDARVNARVRAWDQRAVDGEDKSWVSTVQLAWIRHYGFRKPA
jgi:DNA-binding Xre family transcriptional regulator